MLPIARRSALLEEALGNELVVYDRVRHRAHRLNRVAAAVWRRCDGHTSVRDLAVAVSAELGQPADATVVALALDRLGRAHLLEEPLASTAGRPRLSRREAMRRLGAAGAVAVLGPMVASIAVPSPAVAQYMAGGTRCKNNGGFCASFATCPTNNIGAKDCGGSDICCKGTG